MHFQVFGFQFRSLCFQFRIFCFRILVCANSVSFPLMHFARAGINVEPNIEPFILYLLPVSQYMSNSTSFQFYYQFDWQSTFWTMEFCLEHGCFPQAGNGSLFQFESAWGLEGSIKGLNSMNSGWSNFWTVQYLNGIKNELWNNAVFRC